MATDVATSGDVFIVGAMIAISQFALPFYNTFLKKQELVKEQNDQFHKRDNHALDEISLLKERVRGLEEFNRGYLLGKNEARTEMKK